MTISVGDKVPAGSFMVMGEGGITEVTLESLTKGKSVVIFGLPGAYTGTCSTSHVPSFIRTMAGFQAKGVDAVICVSVNDAFVMKAWGEATGATKAGIMMAADPDAAFTKALGLDFSAGFMRGAARSKRYALQAVDGVVKVLHLEENPGVCDISGGESMLAAI